MAVETFAVPTSLDEALEVLAAQGGRAAVVGGATALAIHRAPRIETLVDLSRCGLDRIDTVGGTVRLGATVCAQAIAADRRLDTLGTGMLREAAAAIAPHAVRNQVTLGGNLVGVLSWSDMPVALLALGARVQTVRPRGMGRTLGIAELFSAHPRKVLEGSEIITAVEVDRPEAGAGGASVKLAQTVSDVAWVNAAALVELRAGRCKSARIAVGAVQPRPLRAFAAEELLRGSDLNDALIAEAAKAAVQDLQIRPDIRSSREYRRIILAAAIRRALQTARARAQGRATYSPPRRLAPPARRRDAAGPDVGRVLAARIDGLDHRIRMRPHDNLLDVMRSGGVLSVKRGCDEGYCGTCGVTVDGRLVNGCIYFAAQADGCEITTAAGIGTVFEPHPLQRAFVDAGAVQCGFCTPGMIVAAKTLLDRIPNPTDEEVREALDGNLCRCTGYVKPLEAILEAARAMRGGDE